MESAENREQSPQANQQEEKSDSQSLSKIETIKLLNESIDQLESTIRDISDNSGKELPSSDSINTLLNTTQELAGSVAKQSVERTVVLKEAETVGKPDHVPRRDTATHKGAPLPTPEVVKEDPVVKKSVVEKLATPETEVKPSEIEPIPPADIKTKPQTNPPAAKIPAKRRVPNVVKPKKKNNRVLITIGAIIGAIAIAAVTWLYLPQIKAAVSPKTEPTSIVIAPEISPNPETIDTPVVDLDESSNVATEDDSLNGDLSTTEAEPEITVPVAIPQDLSSPGRTKNLKIETIEPELTFTPEQTLVAALQTKLAEIVDNSDSDLFENIKVDLSQTSLLVEVTDDWYKLNESRQNKLGNEILKRSRQLNFGRLQIQDSTGKLVARNPVVGDRIIIVQSTEEN